MEGRYSLKPKTGEADAAHCKEEKVAQVMKWTHREEEILQHRREVRVVDEVRSIWREAEMVKVTDRGRERR